MRARDPLALDAKLESGGVSALCVGTSLDPLGGKGGVAVARARQRCIVSALARSCRSSKLVGAAEALLESVGGSLAPSIKWVRDRYIEPVRASLGGAASERPADSNIDSRGRRS